LGFVSLTLVDQYLRSQADEVPSEDDVPLAEALAEALIDNAMWLMSSMMEKPLGSKLGSCL